MTIGSKSSLAAGLLAAILWAPHGADAAGQHFCERYSRDAHAQVTQAYQHSVCSHDLHGTRWARQRRDHFEWCRGVTDSDAQQEFDARALHLSHCIRQ